MVAHWMPGIGNPLAMPIDEFDQFVRILPTIIKTARPMTDRELVEMASG